MTPTFPLITPSAPATPQEETNIIQKLALGLWMVEIVIAFSRFFDQFASGNHIPGVVLVLLIGSSIVSGKLLRGFNTGTGKSMLLFFLWATITVPLGVWRSNSVPAYEVILVSILYFAIEGGVVGTFRQFRQTMNALAVSLFLAAVIGFLFGAYRQERFEFEGGTYHDPNQFAMCLLIGIPLCWFVMASRKTMPAKILAFLGTLVMFTALVKTGSRGGLIGLSAVLILLFLQGSFSKKIGILVFTGIGVMLVLAFLPDYLKVRYMTAFDSNSANLNSQSAEHAEFLRADLDSSEGRKRILIRSIQVTLEYPLFGVGPGNFPVAMFGEAKEHGEKYGWVVTHNSYTQVSTEMGIPGLIFFLAVIINAFRTLRSIYKLTGPRGASPHPDIWKASKYLTLSLTAASVCMFFLSAAFTPEMYVLTSLTIALERAAKNELARQPEIAAPPPRLDTAGFGLRPKLRPAWQREPRLAKPYSL